MINDQPKIPNGAPNYTAYKIHLKVQRKTLKKKEKEISKDNTFSIKKKKKPTNQSSLTESRVRIHNQRSKLGGKGRTTLAITLRRLSLDQVLR